MFAAHALREGRGQHARRVDDLYHTRVNVQVYVRCGRLHFIVSQNRFLLSVYRSLEKKKKKKKPL